MKTHFLVSSVFLLILLAGCNGDTGIKYRGVPQLTPAQIVSGENSKLTFSIENDSENTLTAEVIFDHPSNLSINFIGEPPTGQNFVPGETRSIFTMELGGLDKASEKSINVSGTISDESSQSDYKITITLKEKETGNEIDKREITLRVTKK